MTHDEIKARFNYHKPDANRLALHQEVTKKTEELAHVLADLLPDCREASLAITHLEECRMWANAAIAIRIPDKA